MSVVVITHDLGVVAEMCDELSLCMLEGLLNKQMSLIIWSPKTSIYERVNWVCSKNGQTEGVLDSIKGNVPDPTQMPMGCKFSPRCKDAMPKCFEVEPPVFQMDNGRKEAAGYTKKRGAAYMSNSLLKVKQLNKSFVLQGGMFQKNKVLHAVNDVSFEIPEGKHLVLLEKVAVEMNDWPLNIKIALTK